MSLDQVELAVYKECIGKREIDSIFSEFGNNDLRLRCIMKEDHNLHGGRKGEYTITSKIMLIDFERKFAITKSGNIYSWC